MSRTHHDDQTPPPRFGYEASLWGLVATALLASWLLRWALLSLLPDTGWADFAATALAVVLAAGTVGGLARWRNKRHHTRSMDQAHPPQ